MFLSAARKASPVPSIHGAAAKRHGAQTKRPHTAISIPDNAISAAAHRSNLDAVIFSIFHLLPFVNIISHWAEKK